MPTVMSGGKKIKLPYRKGGNVKPAKMMGGGKMKPMKMMGGGKMKKY